MLKSRRSRLTAVYALCHFAVDLACITTVMGLVAPALSLHGASAHAIAVIAYDMVAFCLQLPIGAALDAAGPARWRNASLASFALTGAGVLAACAPGAPAALLAVLLVALGNALFHCAGAEEVLLEADGAAAFGGLFIATGAAGVFLGGLASFQGWAPVVPSLLALLALCALLVRLLGSSRGEASLTWSLDFRGWLAVFLLAATVAIRSYAGMAMAFPWKAEFALAVAAVAAVVVGKSAGGIVSDRLGPVTASVLSLGIAAPLFLLSWENPLAGIAATLLFNFTMAITLAELVRLLPDAPGMAFGLLSFCLAMGALPALLGLRAATPGLLCALSLVSLVLLLSGIRLARDRGAR